MRFRGSRARLFDGLQRLIDAAAPFELHGISGVIRPGQASGSRALGLRVRGNDDRPPGDAIRIGVDLPEQAVRRVEGPDRPAPDDDGQASRGDHGDGPQRSWVDPPNAAAAGKPDGAEAKRGCLRKDTEFPLSLDLKCARVAPAQRSTAGVKRPDGAETDGHAGVTVEAGACSRETEAPWIESLQESSSGRPGD